MVDCRNGGQWQGSGDQLERGVVGQGACLEPGPGKFAHNAAHSHRLYLCKARAPAVMETPDVFCLAVSTRAKWSKFPRELGDRGHKVRGRLGTEAKAANPEFSRDRDLAWEDFPLFLFVETIQHGCNKQQGNKLRINNINRGKPSSSLHLVQGSGHIGKDLVNRPLGGNLGIVNY